MQLVATRARTPSISGRVRRRSCWEPSARPPRTCGRWEARQRIHYDGRAACGGAHRDQRRPGGRVGHVARRRVGRGSGRHRVALRRQRVCPVASGTTSNLNAVFTLAPNDVWIGGDAGTLLHWDGSSISAVALARDGRRDAGPRHPWHRDQRPLAVGGAHQQQLLVLHCLHVALRRHRVVADRDQGGWLRSESRAAHLGAGGGRRVGGNRSRAVGRAGDLLALRRHCLERDRESPASATFMFPIQEGGSFVFGPHDRWIVAAHGTWQRSTQ